MLKVSLFAAFFGHVLLILLQANQQYLGFFLFLVSSICGMVYAINQRDKTIFLIQNGFAVLTMLEVYKWL